MRKVLLIRRDQRFSPNSEEKDLQILLAVGRRLRQADVQMVEESHLTADADADVYVSMARLPEALRVLADKERQGHLVVNRAESVAACNRQQLYHTMRREGIPMAPDEGNDGYWLKRADTAAQQKGDVTYCADRDALQRAIEAFAARGITQYVVSAHVKGDLVKFYATSAGFFRCYYPTDDHQSKFGDEARNGKAHHYAFDKEALKADTGRLEQAIGIDVYGGDAIIDAAGHYYIIDFNDWPSFSRCREEAAESIASIINE